MKANEAVIEPEPGAATAVQTLLESVEALRSGANYKNYLRAREAILACMAEASAATGDARPSAYWEEELGAFSYMLDASPLIVEKLREHCHHITGDVSYRYRNHHGSVSEPFGKKLAVLNKMDQSDLLVPEGRDLGGYGHEFDGKLINIDTLKFYECMIALDRAKYLEHVKKDPTHKEVWLEIGAGWGGFGRVARTRFPATTYVIVDLPQTMLFSTTYLLTAFPDAKFAIYPEVSAEEISTNLRDYDFVFLPHYLFPTVKLDIDMAINMVSFQEMTTEQVAGYLSRLWEIGCQRVYSLNRDRSAYNDELSAVTDIINDNFGEPNLIRMLHYPYTTLMPPKIPRPAPTIGNMIAQRYFGGKPPAAPPPTTDPQRPTDYRHLVAKRRKSKGK